MSIREEHITTTRSARIYLCGDPSAVHDLWVVCHGFGQLAARFIRDFEGIAAPGRLIVAPEGLHRFYLDPKSIPAAQRRVGATWMTREDRETDIKDYVAYLDNVVDHTSSRVVDRAGARARIRAPRIRALGFSQGSATVFRWAALGATRLDELIVWGGEVPADLDLEVLAERLGSTRVIFVVGDRDALAGGEAAHKHARALDAAGIAYEIRQFEGGHHLDRDLLQSLI